MIHDAMSCSALSRLSHLKLPRLLLGVGQEAHGKVRRRLWRCAAEERLAHGAQAAAENTWEKATSAVKVCCSEERPAMRGKPFPSRDTCF